MPKLVGINPHVNGGIGTWHTELKSYEYFAMPKRVSSEQGKKLEIDGQGLLDLLIKHQPTLTVIEHQKNGTPFAMMNYGIVLGITAGYGKDIVTVKRKAWHKNFGINDNQNRQLTLAKDLFPELVFNKKDHSKATTMLITKYANVVLNSIFPGSLL